ncbi:MAG: type I-B CRISPR-associated protein Cas5b [Thermoprotei archaeon]
MKLLVFDVKSFFAHFRKHFSTTSSLSYSFPPRTTIAGMIAAILGYDRDSYYSIFSSDKCRIALQVKSPVRHITNTLNYLMTDKPLTLKKLMGAGGSMQVHVDTLVSGERELSQLSFRIFFNHEDEKLMNEVADRIRRHKFSYPPSLGTANNIASVEFVDVVDAEVYKPNDEVEVHTVIPISVIKKIYPQHERKIYIEDLVPADFSEDRKLRRKEDYVYEEKSKPIKVKVDCEVFSCTLNGDKVVGVFM